MKKIIIISWLLCILLISGGCMADKTASIQENNTAQSDNSTEEINDTVKISNNMDNTKQANAVKTVQTGMTISVPDEYTKTSSHSGKVVQIEYDSKNYARDSSPVTKTAYVYTPFRYDENDTDTKYDIIYLMHGWGGHAGEYFEYGTKNIFDNLIEKGDIPPVIIVSATFYNENSNTDFSGSISEFRQFHKDFEENLMPTVESKYHTYAKDTTPEGLKASRDHRIFGGFSLGSVTTWLEFCYDYDYIRYFLPMSGSCWYYGAYGDFQIENNVDFIEQLIKDNNLDERGYFIYHAVGTEDVVKSQSVDMANEMLSRDTFTPKHYMFYQKEGGQHDLYAVQEYLYNALPVFFISDYIGTEHMIYISVMNRLSVDCDCDANPAEPDMHDIGILASTDPVALDQACIDFVYASPDSDSLKERIESRNGIHALEHAEKINLGSRAYQLINIDT